MYDIDHNKYFKYLMTNEKFAIERICSLVNNDIFEINNQNLQKIKNNIFETDIKLKKQKSIYKLYNKLNVNFLIKRIENKILLLSETLKRYYNELEIFESELVYLIINKYLNNENLIELNFDNNYIKSLLVKYKDYFLDNCTKKINKL